MTQEYSPAGDGEEDEALFGAEDPLEQSGSPKPEGQQRRINSHSDLEAVSEDTSVTVSDTDDEELPAGFETIMSMKPHLKNILEVVSTWPDRLKGKPYVDEALPDIEALTMKVVMLQSEVDPICTVCDFRRMDRAKAIAIFKEAMIEYNELREVVNRMIAPEDRTLKRKASD